MIKKLLTTIALSLILSSVVMAADFVWTPIPYSSAGLTDFSPSVCITCQTGQYEIDNHGRVFLRGIITCTVDPVPAMVPVFTLPVGFRPLLVTIVPVNFDNDGSNSLQINQDGTVYLRVPFYCNQNVDYLSFEGISFSTK